MNPVTRWLLVAIAILGLLLALASSMGVHAAQEAQRYKDLYEAEHTLLLDAQARTARIQKQVQSAQAQAAAARKSLKEALDASPEFRDTPVPVPVRDSLCGTLHCK